MKKRNVEETTEYREKINKNELVRYIQDTQTYCRYGIILEDDPLIKSELRKLVDKAQNLLDRYL